MSLRHGALIATFCIGAILAATLPGLGAEPPPHEPFSFRTFLGTWSGNGEPSTIEYVRAAKPEVVQLGFFGPMFHTYADEPKSVGYPMQLPVAGQAEALASQRAQIAELKESGAKAVGHFTYINIIDSDDKAENLWERFWNEGWQESIMGKRPEVDPRSLLQQDEHGEPLRRKHYHITYVGLCPNNPDARAFMKQALQVALDSGVDGIMTCYNYYWGCACTHCHESYRAWLKATPEYADTDTSELGRIPAAIPGFPTAENGLSLPAQKWAAISLKQAWDEVFIAYGRQQRPGLILATWNHLGHVGKGEERAFLPLELWGRGEDYFWYSGGYGPTDLENGKLGDGWLNSLYIRALNGGKPFMLGKYESVRLRNSLAEGWATGGAATGLYQRIENPDGRLHAEAYTRFVNQHPRIYQQAEPYAEVALLVPHAANRAGDPEIMESFKRAGEWLASNHYLFTVVVAPDEAVPTLDPKTWEPTPDQPAQRSRIEAPSTVRVASYRVPDGYAIHFVNYNRDEKATEKPRTPEHEHPVAVTEIKVDFRLPASRQVTGVQLLSPDGEETAVELEFERDGDRLRFTVPEVLVYGIVVIVASEAP